MTFFKNNKFIILGTAIGAIAGFLYWQQIGCLSGTCMITSKPLNSTIYGAVMGGLIVSMFKSEKKDQKISQNNNE